MTSHAGALIVILGVPLIFTSCQGSGLPGCGFIPVHAMEADADVDVNCRPAEKNALKAAILRYSVLPFVPQTS